MKSVNNDTLDRNPNISINTALNIELESKLEYLYNLLYNDPDNFIREKRFKLLPDVKEILEEVKALIVEGADPNIEIKDGATLLTFAIITYDHNLLNFLLELEGNRTNLDTKYTNTQLTILHLTCAKLDHLAVFMILKRFQKDEEKFLERLNAQDVNGRKAIDYLMIKEVENSISTMMSLFGVNLNDEDLRSLASENNKTNFLELASALQNFNSHPILYYTKIIEMSNLLIISGRHFIDNLEDEEINLIDELVQYGIDKVKEAIANNARLNPLSKTFLLNAAMSNYLTTSCHLNDYGQARHLNELTQEQLKKSLNQCMDVILFVIENGASPNTQITLYKTSPLHVAAFLKSEEFYYKLLEKGASDTLLDIHNKRPRDYFPEIKSKKQKAITEELPQVSIAERWQKCLDSLEKLEAPKPNKKQSQELAGFLRTLESLAKEDVDISALSSKHGNSAAHLAARFGSVETLKVLAEKNANIETINNRGESALNYAGENGIKEVISAVLSFDSLNLQSILNELKKQITAKNKQTTQAILSHENVIQKIAEQSPKDRNKILTELRSCYKDFNKKNKEEFGSLITSLENSLKQNSQKISDKKPNNNEEKKGPTKKEREAARKAAKEAEEKEKADHLLRKKILKEEKLNSELIEKEISQMLGNDYDAPQIISPEEINLNFIDESEQMAEFLSQKKAINSIYDLPSFLSEKFSELIAQEKIIMLKGSAINTENKRIAQDLDVEIYIQDMRLMSNEEIKELIKNDFGIEISDREIYRGPRQDNAIFTVNAKDDFRKIDFSFYDQKQSSQPRPSLGWLTSKDRKIVFNENGQAQEIRPIGLENFLTKNPDLKEGDFFINPNARFLLTRLCFLAATEQISTEEFNQIPQLLEKTKCPKTITKLLQTELKFHQGNSVNNALNLLKRYADSHNLTPKENEEFLSNFNSFIESSFSEKESAVNAEGLLIDESLLQKLRQELISYNPSTENLKPTEISILKKPQLSHTK